MKGIARGQLFVNLLTFGVVLSIPVAWAAGGYFDIPITALMGFRVDDGFCDLEDALVGIHCFSDFAIVRDLLAAPSPWDPSIGTAYPATGWMPAALVWEIGQILGGGKVATGIFLVILAGVALVPAVWAGIPQWKSRLPLSLLVLGVATSPFLVALDRANSTALIVLPVMAVVLGLIRQRYGWVVTGVVIATLLKPQMIIMILVLIPYRKFRNIVLTVLLSLSGLLLGFLVWPGDRITNIRTWIQNLVGYSDYGALDLLYPYNLSITRSLVTLSDGLGVSALIGETNRGHLVTLLTQYAAVPGVLLTLAVAIIFWMRQRSVDPLTVLFVTLTLVVIAPGTSFSYYLILLLPIAALFLRNPLMNQAEVPAGDWHGYADTRAMQASRHVQARSLIISGALILVMVPLAIPIGRQEIGTGGSTDWIGLMQILWGPILLIASVVLAAMVTLERPRATTS